jgi:AcrR family transcriptional regulator
MQWMSGEEVPSRRTRTSRDDARQNMLRAARELLEDRDPDTLTVREIAERAGHHHRFVQDWFGGKAGLYLEVLNELSMELAEAVELRPAGATPDPRVVRAVKMLSWLAANAPEIVGGDRMRPLVNRMASFYRDRFGVEADQSQLLARHAVLVLTGYVIFKDAYGLADGDFAKLVEIQFRLGQVYGTRSGN